MFHFTAICRQTESRTLRVAYFSTTNVFALCKFILLLSFKNEAVIYLTRGNYSKHFGNRTIERSLLLSLIIDHDNRRVSDFARLPKEIKPNRNLYDHSMYTCFLEILFERSRATKYLNWNYQTKILCTFFTIRPWNSPTKIQLAETKLIQ